MQIVLTESKLNNSTYKTCVVEALHTVHQIEGVRRIFYVKEDGQNLAASNDIIRDCFHIALHRHGFSATDGDMIAIDRSAESGVLRGREKLFAEIHAETGITAGSVIYISQNSRTALPEGEFPQWVYFHEYAIRMADAHESTEIGKDTEVCEKKVLCLNNKVRPHRIATVLAAQAALGDDLVFSWRGNNALFSDEDAVGLACSDFPQTSEFDINNLSRAHAPFPANVGGEALGIPVAVSEKCYMHLICESDYQVWSDRFTEKSLKAVVARRPFLVMGPPGVLNTIRENGFKTFEGIIDESYDCEFNHQRRLEKIISEIVRIHNSDFRLFLDACGDVCEFNNHHLRYKLRDQIFRKFRLDFSAAIGKSTQMMASS